MKILQVSAFHPYVGGAFQLYVGGVEWYCHQLSKHLAVRGHEVHIITSKLDKNVPFNEEKDGFQIHWCPYAGIIWKSNPGTFIMHKLLKVKVDVIHAHSYIFFTSNQVALARKLHRVPFLLHLHGGVDFFLPTNELSTRLKFHLKKRLYDPTLGKWTVETADAVCSVSKRDIELAKNIWGLDRRRLHWVPNAVNIEEFNANKCDKLNVVFIGRLETWKGIYVFLKVAKLVEKKRDDVNFLVVGDGSLKEHVRNNVDNHIRALGQVPHTMIREILSEATVLVLPSYMEGLPTVCLEALAAEVPVVASNVGGIPEVVIDGETGYLFPPGNADLCADRVLRLLSDEPLRRRMGRKGRRLILQFYTWQKVLEKVENIYERIRN